MNETALFYELGPSKTLSCSKVIGTKISKKNVTIALCTNSTGKPKITPFLLITSVLHGFSNLTILILLCF